LYHQNVVGRGKHNQDTQNMMNKHAERDGFIAAAMQWM
jgi:hypothetical protein